MKILITGANGYVGNALIEDLKKPHQIIATARNIHQIEHQGVLKRKMDILDEDNVNAVIAEIKPDIIIHAAALPKRNHDSEEVFISTNVSGITNVAKAAAGNKCGKLILFSSGCAFKQVEGQINDENSERELGTTFSRSKNLAEEAVEKVLKESETSGVILYPPIIFHKSQVQGIVPYALKDACEKGVITNKVPEGHVNFITHEKLAELIEVIISDDNKHKAKQGLQKFLITGCRFTTKEFFEKMAGIFEEKFHIKTAIDNKRDEYYETMCETSENSITKIAPNFSWGSVDKAIEEIALENLKKGAFKTPLSGFKTGGFNQKKG